MSKELKNKNGYFCIECGHKKYLYHLFKSNLCLWCKKKTNNETRIFVSDSVPLRDRIKARKKKKGFKKFSIETISGWFQNIITGDTKYGVSKKRTIDKEKNEYHETIRDLKTGEIIHDCHEKLTEHKRNKKSKN